MKVLLDTHFLLWIVQESHRLDAYPWVFNYSPLCISPISIIELQFLAEVGKIKLDLNGLMNGLKQDHRFRLDDVPLMELVSEAVHLTWARDPFDRLLTAHSLARRLALCSVDSVIRQHHRLLPRELLG